MKENTNTIETEQVTAMNFEGKIHEDLKHAVLIVSLLANMFILIGWVALKVTAVFDYQVALFLFYR